MNKKGFSLIEIISIIGIISILTAMTIFSANNFSISMKLSGDAKELTSNLKLAQQLAVTEQKDHLLRINQTNSNYQLIKIQDSTEEVINTKNLSDGISFNSLDLTPETSDIKFNSAGTASASGTITLLNTKAQNKIIEIAPSGFVKIQ